MASGAELEVGKHSVASGHSDSEVGAVVLLCYAKNGQCTGILR